MTRHETLEVHVDVDGATLLAGRAYFHRTRGGLASTTFQYDPTYLSQPHAYPVDPAFDLYAGTQQSTGLPGAFGDSAPDRWGRNLITRQERALARKESRRPRALDDVDFLAGVGDITRQGALRFRNEAATPFLDPDHTVPQLVHLPELLHAADSAASDTDDYAAVKALLAAGTGSLGGARPKASVLGDGGLQLIAKFPHHGDDWDVMAWEATALDLASRAGVTVARHRLSVIDGRHLLLLERFDRYRKPSGDLCRIGYMSAMTLLGLHDGDSADYADIAERLPEISARASDDALQLFRRVAVSVGLNNTDDHLRNHGFLRVSSGWTLSPAFDVNPDPDQQYRQTSILGADGQDDQAAALVEFAAECRLPPARAKTELLTIADSLSGWREVATGNGVRGPELARFERSFTTGIGALRQAAA